MRSVSDAFIRSLPGSHKMLVRARICDTFQTGTNPIGTFVPVIDGGITLDGKAATRTTLDITLDGTRKWPIFKTSLYAPYGNEIFVERGIEYSDASVEYLGFGYLRIQDPEQDIPSDNPIRLNAVDRMQAIIDGRLLAPRQFVSGTTFGVVVQNLITEIYPLATIEWDDNTNLSTLTRSVIVEDDRYGFLNDAITSRGKIWYWDYRGVLVIKSVPNPAIVSYNIVNAAGGNLVTMHRKLTREGTYNAVVATGEAPDTNTPRRGVAIDGDAASPTYFYGRFGQVPFFYSSSFLGTDAQCVAAAQALLNQKLGLQYTIDFGTIVNPALEPYDVINVSFSNSEASQTHIVDTLSIPLTEGSPMTGTTREKRVTLASPI